MVVKKGFDLFVNEAERWYKILSAFRLPHLPEKKKDVSKTKLRFSFNSKTKSIRTKLSYLYGEEKGKELFEKIERKMKAFIKKKPKKLKYKDAYFNPLDRFTQKDVILITYPDSIYEKEKAPLKSLLNFTRKIEETTNTIHLLPFFPYSSDRGFSVMNYKKVKPNFGTWEDIKALGEKFNLMFDGVFNHVSSKSLWFKYFLKGSPVYDNHFITFGEKNAISKEDLKKIIRPRTSDVITEFKTRNRRVYAWTTFGPDQVDLNYKESRVLLRIIDVIFRYLNSGATIIRLDAINYIWKEIGTSCVHLKQTHVVVQLLRDILDITAPSVSIVTETNVPHSKNISYLGNGRNEAQMVYNFTLPPLVLYTFYRGNCRYLSRWASRLEKISNYCSYFNFLASHDGIGLSPAERVLPQKEVKFMVKKARQNGSLVLNKSQGAGYMRPYELDVTWWSAINMDDSKEDEETQIRRYMATHAIALSLKGVPGIYIHSFFGTKNDYAGVKKSNFSRDINRKNLNFKELKKELSKHLTSKKVFDSMRSLIKVRLKQKAFHPSAGQEVFLKNDEVFSIIRTSMDKQEKLLVLTNVTSQEITFTVNLRELKLFNDNLFDIINKRRLLPSSESIRVNEFDIILKPYEVLWLRSKEIIK